MVANARVTAAFRRLVALLARAFYAGECPPLSAEELDAPVLTKTKTKKQQVEQTLLPTRTKVVRQLSHHTIPGYNLWSGDHPAGCSLW